MGNKKLNTTLFENLLNGAGTVLDIYPQTPIYKRKYSANQYSDYESIKKDFDKIGKDMWKVIDGQEKTKLSYP